MGDGLPEFDQPYYDRYGVIAGVDEAGRGPLAGPVVAAAVILPRHVRLEALNDSKKVPAPLRERLYADIQACAVAIGIGVVEADHIDQINIYQATRLAMRQALMALHVRPAMALVDGRPFKNFDFPHCGVIGGDGKSASIAAASIMAKVTRDRRMVECHREYPGYDFHRHKGYGTPAHLERLRALGPCHIHRRSFAPVAQLQKESE